MMRKAPTGAIIMYDRNVKIMPTYYSHVRLRDKFGAKMDGAII